MSKRWADEDSSDEDEARQYRTDLQAPKEEDDKEEEDGFFDGQFQEQQDRRYQDPPAAAASSSSGGGGGGGYRGGGGGSYRQSQEPQQQRRGRGGGGGGSGGGGDNRDNRDRGNSRRGGGGGGGGGRSDWKAEARASSQFSASATSSDQKLDGSSWMAKRQSKMQQQEAEARKMNEGRKARADEEAAERRAKQVVALEVSVLLFAVCCPLRLLSIY